MPREKSKPTRTILLNTQIYRGTIINIQGCENSIVEQRSPYERLLETLESCKINPTSNTQIFEHIHDIDELEDQIFHFCQNYREAEETTEAFKIRIEAVLKNPKKLFCCHPDTEAWSLNDQIFGIGISSNKRKRKQKFSSSPLKSESKESDPEDIFSKFRKVQNAPIFDLGFNPTDLTPEELLEKVKESKLTSLQILISIAILSSPNCESKLDNILSFVCHHQDFIVGKDGIPKSTDPKRAILASLSKNASTNPLFVKGNEENTWRIGPNNVFHGCTTVPNGLIECISQNRSLNDTYELTELQKLIMTSISMADGPCPLKKIYNFVKPKYNKLKRRDGTSYASNAKRAIQASLSNNSSNRPIFQMVEGPDGNDTYWILTDRGEEYLVLLKTDPDFHDIFEI